MVAIEHYRPWWNNDWDGLDTVISSTMPLVPEGA